MNIKSKFENIKVKFISGFVVFIFSIENYNIFCSSNYLFNSTHDDFINQDEKLMTRFNNINQDSLYEFPAVIPNIIEHPSPGYFFFEKNYSYYSYILIVNNYGKIIFSRKYDENIHNFTIQPNGSLSYYSLKDACFYTLDSTYHIKDKYYLKNNYITDSHEFILFENGHSIMMAYDPQIIDMSQIVEGGNKYATVVGLVIQELDENKNVIFEWKSWDHINITDTDNSIIDLQGQYIDYIHGNSISIDTDSTLLLSSRNLNEITKINRNSGNIIWRLGGNKNQFFFINDSGFARQHSIARLKNGNILIFDNGTGTRNYSRGVEYQIDEDQMTITKINEFRHVPDVFSPLMGHIQRLENGNTLIGWGKNIGNNIFSEFNNEGVLIADYTSNDNIKSYRATKFLWKNNALLFESDSLYFDTIIINTEKIIPISITNNLNYSVELTGYNKLNTPYYILNLFPLAIEPYNSTLINIAFNPYYQGDFSETIFIFSNHLSDENEIQRIGCEIYVNGYGIKNTTVPQNQTERNIIIYPNPARDYLEVFSEKKIIRIEIIDILTKKSLEKSFNYIDNLYRINISDLNFGIYLIKLNDEYNNTYLKKVLIQ
ncbi:MAG: aryl-sulfate sulfotransferase [Bacteroidales bacterium]|nr:aryl-sulfate sulfotransferase [Bacteroidales bacterium]